MPAREKFFIAITIFLAIFLFFPKNVFSQIVINEFSSGTTSDWVEIYNTGTESARLSNLRIRDSTTSNKKDLSGELTAGGFLVVPFSNWLNSAGDVVKLIMIVGENEELLEEIPYGTAGGLCAAPESGSIGRFPDGGPTLVRFVAHTQNTSNNTAQEFPCPTPTSTPTPELTPTPTLTSRPTSTPKLPTPTPTVKLSTPTLISTSTPKPTFSPTPTPTLKTTPTEATKSGEVLGEEEEATVGGFYPLEATEEAEKIEEATPAGKKSNKNKILGGIFLGAGLVAIFGAAFSLWYTKLK